MRVTKLSFCTIYMADHYTHNRNCKTLRFFTWDQGSVICKKNIHFLQKMDQFNNVDLDLSL